MSRTVFRLLPAVIAVILVATVIALRPDPEPEPEIPREDLEGLVEVKDRLIPIAEAPGILADRQADADDRIDALDAYFPEEGDGEELPFELLL